jgi:hypothetical protein
MTKKKTIQANSKVKATPISESKNTENNFFNVLTTNQLLGATMILAGFYFLYSRSADGFYQQDEAAHFVSMKGFWHNPHSILSNWAKPGYKILYALPSLLGTDFVMFINCLVSAFTCFFAYKIAKLLDSQIATLAFVLTATQPLWINLAFRNYSELITALLLCISLYFHLKNKFVLASFIASYIAFIRQEFYPILGLYFLYLAVHRHFIAAVLLGVFPLIQQVWGMALTGDPLYLFTQIFGTSEQIAGQYPRKGFLHYFKMSITIFGSVSVTLWVAYLWTWLFEKIGNLKNKMKIQDAIKDKANFILVVSLLYFLMNCIFNSQTLQLGPATGGNLRYLLIISPLVAILGTLQVEKFKVSHYKTQILILLGVFALLVAIFMTYTHNFVIFNEKERDWIPLLGVLLSVVLLMLPLKPAQDLMGLGTIALVFVLLTVRPIKLSEEDKTCKTLARWYENYELAKGEPPLLFVHHEMFYYFLGKTSYDFKAKPKAIEEKFLKDAPKGSVVIWDSHYSYRPKMRPESLMYEYFTEKPTQYDLINQIVADDQSFGVLIFEKK